MEFQRERGGGHPEQDESTDQRAFERLRDQTISNLKPYLELPALSTHEWDAEDFDRRILALREYLVLPEKSFSGLHKMLSAEPTFQEAIARGAKIVISEKKKRLNAPYAALTSVKGDFVNTNFTQFIHRKQNDTDDWEEMGCVDPEIPVGIHYKRYLSMNWDITEMEKTSPMDVFMNWYAGIYEALDEFFADASHRQIGIKVGSRFDTLISSADHIVIYSYKENDPTLQEFEALLRNKLEKRRFRFAPRLQRAPKPYDFNIWNPTAVKKGEFGCLGKISSHATIVAALILLELSTLTTSLHDESNETIAKTLDAMIQKYNSYEPDQAWETLQAYRPLEEKTPADQATTLSINREGLNI